MTATWDECEGPLQTRVIIIYVLIFKMLQDQKLETLLGIGHRSPTNVPVFLL